MSLRENASKLISLATVNSMPGLIILPDNFNAANVRFSPSTSDVTANIYNAEEWRRMEEAGAVFLPCAGLSKNVNNGNDSDFSYSTELVFGIAAQVPDAQGDNERRDEKWFQQSPSRYFVRQINGLNPSEVAYFNMDCGFYWQSTTYPSDTLAAALFFGNQGIPSKDGIMVFPLSSQFAVRLVKDVE